VWAFFGQGGKGFFQRCAARNLEFVEFMVCPHGQGGLNRIFRTRGKRVKFSRFCADGFYGRYL